VNRVENNILNQQDDVSWGPNQTFKFPKTGGTGAVWKALALTIPNACKQLNTSVETIDFDSQIARLKSGKEIKYQHLISTMPLDLLCSIGNDPQLKIDSQKLTHSSTHIIGLGLKGQVPESLKGKCWMYFPESNCPFYRVTVFSYYSPQNVPDSARYWSLMLEVSESPVKPVDSDRILEQTIQGAIATRLIKHSDQIESSWIRRFEHGYPTPFLGRDAILKKLLPVLEQKNVYSRGRFGAWKYEVSNQDHSYMQGVEVINRILGKINAEEGPEPTLNRPKFVNTRIK